MKKLSLLRPPPFSKRSRLRRSRRGAVYMAELLLTMPIFMIFLLAIVQFGIFFANAQLVSMASRVGAEAASESPLPIMGAVPSDILTAIEQHLQSNGIDYCQVRVEHNVGGVPSELTSGTCNCTPTMCQTPPGEFVRVSVCVQLTELMPNLLDPFGYDISGPDDLLSCATVMRHDL